MTSRFARDYEALHREPWRDHARERGEDVLEGRAGRGGRWRAEMKPSSRALVQKATKITLTGMLGLLGLSAGIVIAFVATALLSNR